MLPRITSLVLLCLMATLATAGEVKLRGYYQAQGTLVRLGDVAEFTQVTDEDRAAIESLLLFPAPQAGLARRVTAQDVREILSLHGVSLPKLRVTGECRVEGSNGSDATPSEAVVASHQVAEPAVADSAASKEHLATRVVAYLQTKERIRTQWQVKPALTDAQATAIEAMQRPEISGGQAPWVGRQVFNVRDQNAVSKKAMTFKADVERVAQAVVSRRALAAGAIVTADDVEIGEVNPLALTNSAMLNLADVLGKEVKQAIAANQIVQTQSLRRPLVIKRNELITVYSLAAGIQVKATAKALADGALGDVILLEAAETKKQFQGRVTAPQEAMVFVDTPTVAAEASPTIAEKQPKDLAR
jgi:flagella basal body P-ring formation protein FlgA